MQPRLGYTQFFSVVTACVPGMGMWKAVNVCASSLGHDYESELRCVVILEWVEHVLRGGCGWPHPVSIRN